MQRGASVNAHGFCSFLELMLAGFAALFIIIIIPLFLVAASSGPLLLLLGLAAATSSATELLVGPSSAILGLLLVSPFILGFLLIDKLLNLPTVLEIVALGAVDLAVLLGGALRLVGSRQGLTCGTPGNLLVGAISLNLLGSTGVAESLDGKHGLALALPVSLLTLLQKRGGVFAF